MNKKRNLVAKQNLAEARTAAERFEALRKQELDQARGGVTRDPDDGTAVFIGTTPVDGSFTTIRPLLRW